MNNRIKKLSKLFIINPAYKTEIMLLTPAITAALTTTEQYNKEQGLLRELAFHVDYVKSLATIYRPVAQAMAA